MVDIDTGGSDGNSGSKKGKSKKNGKKPPKGGEDVEAHSLDEEQKLDPDGVDMAEPSKNLAEGGELNYDNRSGENFKKYVSRQISECEELYEDMEEHIKDVENYEEFAIFMHALYMNFGMNRVGIMNTIMDEFGKSEKEAMRYTDKICRKAGEQELHNKVVRYITKDFAGE